MLPIVMLLIGLVTSAGIGFVYNVASTSNIEMPHGPRPGSSTTPTPVTAIRIPLSEDFNIRATDLRRIVEYFAEGNSRRGRARAIWRIDPETATDRYNGGTQRSIHHFIPGDLLRNTFFRELSRPANEWIYIVQMLRVAVENLDAVPTNQRAASDYDINIANWTLDLFDERVRSTPNNIFTFDYIIQGLERLYRVFFWSSFNLLIGPLPQHRQPADPGNQLDVQLIPVMTLDRSIRSHNLYEYVASKRNFDNNAVTDYISLTTAYKVPTSSGPWRPISNTLDDYFRELVRISRGENQPPVDEAVDYLSPNNHLMIAVREQFRNEVINELKACEECQNAISSTDEHDCLRKKCPFFIKKKNTYYILDAWSVMRNWIKLLLGTKEGVTPSFSLPDNVEKKYFNCDDDRNGGAGGGSCSSLITQNQNDDVSQYIEHFDRAFTKQNPDIEYSNIIHLPNRYLQPFGNALIMSSLTPVVVDCLVLLHNNPVRSGIASIKNRRRRYRVNENDTDVKYNSQYLLKLVELIHQDMSNSEDELSIFKQLVTGTTSPLVQSSLNRVCH